MAPLQFVYNVAGQIRSEHPFLIRSEIILFLQSIVVTQYLWYVCRRSPKGEGRRKAYPPSCISLYRGTPKFTTFIALFDTQYLSWLKYDDLQVGFSFNLQPRLTSM